MKSIDYKLSTVDRSGLLEPLIRATELIMRYNGLIEASTFKNGLNSREHFFAAVASIYLQGGLIELNDLVLHAYNTDVSISHQDIADAMDILAARRLIETKKREWLFEADSFQLTQQPTHETSRDKTAIDDFERELEDIDAILERTNKILENPETLEIKPNRLKQLLKPKNQDEIWEKWQEVIKSTQHEPPILRSAILLDAWINLDPIPNKPWLGFEYANTALRVDLSLDYLPSITTGLRQTPLNTRKNHNRLKRLKAYIDAYALSSEQAIRNAHKIKVRYERLQERTENIRAGSKTKAFIDYAIATPVVTTTNAAAALNISPAGVLKILKTLQLREITGRSRYRVWAI